MSRLALAAELIQMVTTHRKAGVIGITSNVRLTKGIVEITKVGVFG
jgi:hypothetical protein